MTRSSRRSRVGLSVPILTAAVASACALGACNPTNKVKDGAPVMVSFAVVDPTGASVDLSPTDAGPVLVPPLSTFAAVFDRLLDPTPLALLGGETMEANGTRTEISSKAGVAVIESGGVSVPADVVYVPNGDAKFALIFAQGPSLAVLPSAGLPSGSMVSAHLDENKVRSHDQSLPFKPADDVSGTLTFQTEPLTVVSFDVPVGEPQDGGTVGPAPPAAADYVAHVAFNNLTADTTEAAITVAPMGGGTAIAGVTVARDMASPVGWTVTPPTGGWPAGAALTITVAATAADNFMKTLGTAATADFTVAP